MNDGVIFNTAQADRIADVVRSVESAGPDLRGPSTGPRPARMAFWAKITGADGLGAYSWRRQVSDGESQLVDDGAAIEGELNATEVNFLIPDEDSVVYLTFAGRDDDKEPQYIFSIGWRKQGFNVYVTMDGGDPGDATSPCTYTYTVKDAWGNTLATAVPLSRPRPAKGAFVAAPEGSRATAYRTSTDPGDLVLWDVAEVLDPEAC